MKFAENMEKHVGEAFRKQWKNVGNSIVLNFFFIYFERTNLIWSQKIFPNK